jgi:hypothetical protein
MTARDEGEREVHAPTNCVKISFECVFSQALSSLQIGIACFCVFPCQVLSRYDCKLHTHTQADVAIAHQLLLLPPALLSLFLLLIKVKT